MALENDKHSAGARRNVLATVHGSLAADVLIAAIAIFIGTTHGAAWVAIPAIIGLAAAVVCYRRVRARLSSPIAAHEWLRRRGMRQVLALGLPQYIVLAGAAISLPRH